MSFSERVRHSLGLVLTAATSRRGLSVALLGVFLLAVTIVATSNSNSRAIGDGGDNQRDGRRGEGDRRYDQQRDGGHLGRDDRSGSGYTGDNHNGPQTNRPPNNGPPNTGRQHDGPHDNGPQNSGPPNNGPPNNGPQYNGPQNNGPQHSGPENSAMRRHHGPPHDQSRQGPDFGGGDRRHDRRDDRRGGPPAHHDGGTDADRKLDELLRMIGDLQREIGDLRREVRDLRNQRGPEFHDGSPLRRDGRGDSRREQGRPNDWDMHRGDNGPRDVDHRGPDGPDGRRDDLRGGDDRRDFREVPRPEGRREAPRRSEPGNDRGPADRREEDGDQRG